MTRRMVLAFLRFLGLTAYAACQQLSPMAKLRSAPYVAPLCPAGHLPRKGGDRPAAVAFANLDRRRTEIGGSARSGQSPPLRGRCPAGQRGALSRQPFRLAAPHRFTSHVVTRSPDTGSLPSLSWIPCARSSSRILSASAQFFSRMKREAASSDYRSRTHIFRRSSAHRSSTCVLQSRCARNAELLPQA